MPMPRMRPPPGAHTPCSHQMCLCAHRCKCASVPMRTRSTVSHMPTQTLPSSSSSFLLPTASSQKILSRRREAGFASCPALCDYFSTCECARARDATQQTGKCFSIQAPACNGDPAKSSHSPRAQRRVWRSQKLASQQYPVST
jgi:hypothetical protein